MKVPEDPDTPLFRESRNISAWSTFNIVLLILYFGLVHLDLKFEHGFTRIGPAVGSTFFNTARYSAEWWFVFLLIFNALLPALFLFAVENNDVPPVMTVHKIFSILVALANTVVFVFCFVWYFGWCNSGISPGAACNDGLWCGSFFAVGTWCQNGLPCGSGNLAINGTFLAFWICSGFAIIVALINIWAGWHLRRVGFISPTEMVAQ